ALSTAIFCGASSFTVRSPKGPNRGRLGVTLPADQSSLFANSHITQVSRGLLLLRYQTAGLEFLLPTPAEGSVPFARPHSANVTFWTDSPRYDLLAVSSHYKCACPAVTPAGLFSCINRPS